MPWKSGSSGNPKGRKPGPNKITGRIRALIDDNSADILTKVIEQAKGGDSQAQATFLRLMPKHRFVSAPIELSAAKDSDQAKLQINKLVSLCASGVLDLESLKTLTDALRISIDGRQSELEALVRELVEKQEDTAHEH